MKDIPNPLIPTDVWAWKLDFLFFSRAQVWTANEHILGIGYVKILI
jgi:hypothetical protein